MNFSDAFDEKFFRFILVGIINTIVGSAIMFLLYNAAHLNYWLSSASNYFVTSILSFFLNKYFTFRVRNWSVFMVLSFVLTIGFSYLLAYGIAKPLVNRIFRNSTVNIRENIALLSGMCLFTGINYFGQRFFVFSRKKEKL